MKTKQIMSLEQCIFIRPHAYHQGFRINHFPKCNISDLQEAMGNTMNRWVQGSTGTRNLVFSTNHFIDTNNLEFDNDETRDQTHREMNRDTTLQGAPQHHPSVVKACVSIAR